MAVSIAWDMFGVQCIYKNLCTVDDVLTAVDCVDNSLQAAALGHCLHDFSLAQHITHDTVAAALNRDQFSRCKEDLLLAIVLPQPTVVPATVHDLVSIVTHPTQVFHDRRSAISWILKAETKPKKQPPVPPQPPSTPS